MATFQRFVDIHAWQKARQLVYEIYKISNRGSFFKDFRLRGQIRDAGISVMSNIAEGFERDGSAEFVQFLAIAKGSTGEVISQLYVALDQGYITEEEFEGLSGLARETGRMIGALMGYLRKSGIKGTKFKANSKSKISNAKLNPKHETPHSKLNSKPETRNSKL
ncbi:MAG: four helix bundle protein [Candidatus Binatia bacterium]